MHTSDILIVGAGPTGMALGVALAMRGRKPAIVDARPAGAAMGDRRVLALSHGSQQILQRLGAWERIEATPIRTIHVSQQGGFGRTLLHANDYGVDALGHVASAASVAEGLAGRLEELGIAVRHQCRVTNLAAGAADVLVSQDAAAGETLSAKLVALAEGAIAQEPETQVVTRDYGQHAVICTATPAGPHGGTAFERFTPHGPLALLPFGRDHAVVFTVPAAESDALLTLDDASFLARLQQAIGTRVTLTAVGPRAKYPLLLRYRRDPVGQRTVWIGNAAQTLHPVAGQGFNLALRDVWDLAETVATIDPQADPGAPQVLARYASARRIDRHGVIGFTDTLIRVFSNDVGPMRIARGGGLAALDLVPPLKHFVAKRMMFGARAWP